MTNRREKRRALRRARLVRRQAGLVLGLCVGALLALCMVLWAQIGAWPMLIIVFGANMLLGALFGQAITLVASMSQTEWRILPPPVSDMHEVAWTPPPAPLSPLPRPLYLQSRPFAHAHIYGAEDLLTLLRARHRAGNEPLPGQVSLRDRPAAVIQS